LEGLGISLGYLLVQILNFLIVLVILRAWVYRPVLEMLDRRRKTIAQGLEDARLAGEARASAEKEAQGILTKAQQAANQRLRQASEDAERAAREIKTAAEKEAVDIRGAASAEAERKGQQALVELRGQMAALSIAAAEKLVREALDEKRQRALIAEFFSGIQGGKVKLLEGENLAGTTAEVTSALPLTSSEQQTIRQEVGRRLGAGSSITFKVDPSVLGGLIISVGDKVLDGSVAGGLDSLRQSLR
jgi:F-type H+-transporting ATPase subunit b